MACGGAEMSMGLGTELGAICNLKAGRIVRLQHPRAGGPALYLGGFVSVAVSHTGKDDNY